MDSSNQDTFTHSLSEDTETATSNHESIEPTDADSAGHSMVDLKPRLRLPAYVHPH